MARVLSRIFRLSLTYSLTQPLSTAVKSWTKYLPFTVYTVNETLKKCFILYSRTQRIDGV